MDTIAIKASAAAVTGARHLRSARNGQDAAVAWTGRIGARGGEQSRGGAAVECDGRSSAIGHAGALAASDAAVVVVCDGCSSGASSEVGARLGATLFARTIAMRLLAGESPGNPAMWSAVRLDVVRALAELLERMPGDRADVIREHFLFTVVAAAATRDEAAVWAIGDGAYSLGDYTRVLGPFEDNAPPYVAYDLFGEPRAAELAIAPPRCGAIVIATDGACELDDGLEEFAAERFVTHPDALRRQLALLARTPERIDWDERRVVRTPAVLQDDCAIGILRWSAP